MKKPLPEDEVEYLSHVDLSDEAIGCRFTDKAEEDWMYDSA